MIKVRLENVRIFNFNPYRDKKTEKMKASWQFLDLEENVGIDYFTSDEDCVREMENNIGVDLNVDIELRSNKFGLQLGNIISIE